MNNMQNNMQNNTDEYFNEEFERLMKLFLSEEFKDVKLDDMQTEDDDDPFLEDEDVDEYGAEDNTPTEKADDMVSLAFKSRDVATWGNARFIANQLERI